MRLRQSDDVVGLGHKADAVPDLVRLRGQPRRLQEGIDVVAEQEVPLDQPDHVQRNLAAKGARELAAERELLEVRLAHGLGQVVDERVRQDGRQGEYAVVVRLDLDDGDGVR